MKIIIILLNTIGLSIIVQMLTMIGAVFLSKFAGLDTDDEKIEDGILAFAAIVTFVFFLLFLASELTKLT